MSPTASSNTSFQFRRILDRHDVLPHARNVLTLSTDLNKLPDEIRLSAPHYFLNVPTLLERVKRGVEDALSKRPALIRPAVCRRA